MSSSEASNQEAFIKEEDFADIEICLIDMQAENAEESKNTNKATDVSWRIFSHFLEEKYPDISMETITKFELNEILSRFYMDVRKKNGDMYTKSSMNSIRFGIQRKFKQMRANVDIIEDAEFSSSSEMFKARCFQLKKQGLAKVEHKPSIKRADMIKLYTSPVLSPDQPRSLQRKVFLDIMLFLCKRGPENFRELNKSSFALKTDLHGLEYVEKVIDPKSKDRDEHMLEDGGIMAATNTRFCPVYSFKLYLTRLDPDSEIFFQRPKPFAPPTGPWYHPQMLGKHCFGKMMKGISSDANLSFKYTNHCIRATSVSVLDDAGLEARDIMAVSGHKSESSIRTYARSGIGTKKKMSDALAFYVHPPDNDSNLLTDISRNGDNNVTLFFHSTPLSTPINPLNPVQFNQNEEPPPNKFKKMEMPSSDSSDVSDEDSIDTGIEANGGSEMTSLINSFGADVSKTLSAKRKRFSAFTSASMKTSNKKYDEIFSQQHTEREQILEEYGNHINGIFTQWEGDIQKAKEEDDKLENIVRQLQKTLQQQRVVQNQRLKSLKTLHEQFTKKFDDLGKAHRDQQSNIRDELRNELTALQNKMTDDARQEEISNVKKSLHNMLSQV